jgi:sporulation protein YlmC with PRC-barrel domain
MIPDKMTPRLLSATSMKGTNVKNPSGEDIGEIQDLMIDWNNASISYAVLSFGGFLGMGDKYFAIPIEAFEFDAADTEGRIILNVDKERLEDAPGFDKDNWPMHADSDFVNSVYSFYGVERHYA